MIDLQATEKWLTSSIGGIVVLSTVGSIIAAVLIYLSRRLFNSLRAAKDHLILRLLYPYFREFAIGQQMRDVKGPTTQDSKYIIYHIYASTMVVGDLIAFFMFLALCIFVAITYGITRPYLLSTLIALTINLFHQLLKSGMRIRCHCDNDLKEQEKRAESSVPKRFSLSHWHGTKL